MGSRDIEKTEETVMACFSSPFSVAKIKTFCLVVLKTSRNFSFKVDVGKSLTNYLMYYHE